MNDELKIKNNELGGKMNYRYRTAEEMKDSGVEWLDVIPKSWTRNKLKRELKFLVGSTPSTSNRSFFEGENIWVTIGDLNGKYCSESKTKLTEEALRSTNMKKVPKGSLLYSFKLSVGQVAFTETDLYTNEAIASFYPNNNSNLDFWYYALGNYLIENSNENIYGAKLLNQELINNANIFVPSEEEQKKIAKFLDKKTAQFDSIISKKEALIEKLEEAKKSLISEVVTGKVRVVKTDDGYELVERKKEEMKDSGVEWLGDIPKKWNVKKIKYISKIYRGKFNHRPRNDPEFYDGEYPFIQTGDVANSNMYITKYTQTLNKKGYSVSKEFPKGTLIMTIAANIGDIAILDFNACFPDSIVGFTPNNNIDIKFMYYIYSIMKEEFMSTAIINTQMNLNVERIENLFIVVPNIEKQKIIVDYIESKLGNIMNTINKVRQQIQKLKEAKQSLISEAVTGKIEILD